MVRAAVGVKAVVVNQQGLVLLLKKANKSHWDIPGGGMNVTEDLHQTLIREISEETGLQADDSELLHVATRRHHRRGLSLYVMYKVQVQGQPEIKLSSEHSQFEWLTPQQAIEYDLADRYRQAIAKLIT